LVDTKFIGNSKLGPVTKIYTYFLARGVALVNLHIATWAQKQQCLSRKAQCKFSAGLGAYKLDLLLNNFSSRNEVILSEKSKD